ncbi:MAG: recombinase family protein [Clostridia bacterium]|nr:recombinase family protein [Clostridia bacterium]
MEYGYCRVSTQSQNIERQVRNIQAAYPKAKIIREVYTGTTFQGRDKLEKLLKVVKADDTIIFDSVSRMSRSADEGFALYESLFSQGVHLVFLKEPHINTETYRKALAAKVGLTGDKVDFILEGVNRYLMELAKEQIRLAFEQSQKEVDDMRQRTKEGMLTAKLNGKQIGQKQGSKLHVKKADAAKKEILEHSKDFGGSLSDKKVMKLAGVSANTYYKYKAELKQERSVAL